MKRFKRFIKGYEKETVLAPVFKMLEALFDLFVPLVVADIIDQGAALGDMHYVLMRFLLLVVLAAVGLACSITAQYFAAKASAGYASSLRQALFSHILNFAKDRRKALGSDTLITRMTSDINQIQTGLNLTLRLVLRSPFVVFGSVILAFTIDVKAAILFVIAVPLLAVTVFTIMLVTIPLFRKVQKLLDHVTALTRENLTGIRVIRAFNAEERETQEFRDANASLRKMNEFTGRISALMNPLTYLIINAITVWLIHTGALEVSFGVLKQGQVVALYNYMAQITVEMIKLADLIIQINRALACGKRVQEVLDLEEGMTFPKQDPVEKKDGPAVVCSHVSYRYADAPEDALTDISFTIDHGKSLGIIGGTGSGKSTLISLLPRYSDVREGVIRIDGADVKTYPKETLRRKFGVAPQKAQLFRGTIRENLLYGDADASEEAIGDAIRISQAADVIAAKAKGIDEELEPGAKNLSGGQKQRLTIARALVSCPEILILDDSDSALDLATSARLRKGLSELKDTTRIIVSQRVSSIAHCDEILVLDDGRQAGLGSHEELMKDCAVYREICASQNYQEVQA